MSIARQHAFGSLQPGAPTSLSQPIILDELVFTAMTPATTTTPRASLNLNLRRTRTLVSRQVVPATRPVTAGEEACDGRIASALL
jgi:hypothetical protein